MFRARVFWLGHAPLELGNRYTLKLGTSETDVTVQSIERDRHRRSVGGPADQVERNGVAEVVLRARGLLALDEHRVNPLTGRFVLVDDHVPGAAASSRWKGIPTSAT